MIDNSGFNLKTYKRDCILGAIGAFLMLVGDLCLSVIPASIGDSGLFMREAYLSGAYETWRLQLLISTEVIGMPLCYFAVKSFYELILPEYKKTRALFKVSGIIYLTSAGVIHFFIGSFADWTSKLSLIIGREETTSLIQSQYNKIMPTLLLPYAGMILLIAVSFYALVSKKTFQPRKMAFCHMIIFQILFAIIPDIRQLLGAPISTWDFVLSQGSGNAALLIWMVSGFIWALLQTKNEKVAA